MSEEQTKKLRHCFYSKTMRENAVKTNTPSFPFYEMVGVEFPYCRGGDIVEITSVGDSELAVRASHPFIHDLVYLGTGYHHHNEPNPTHTPEPHEDKLFLKDLPLTMAMEWTRLPTSNLEQITETSTRYVDFSAPKDGE